MNPSNRQWFTVTLASDYSTLSVRTLRRAIQQGKLKASRSCPGGRWLIHRRNLDSFLMFGKCRLSPTERLQYEELTS